MTNLKKAFSLLLVVALVLSVVPAAATDGLSNSTPSVDYEDWISTNPDSLGDHDVEVMVTKGSNYMITIPKTVVLAGATGIGSYAVKVEGDLSGSEYITVEPYTTTGLNLLEGNNTFDLTQTGKDPVPAKVTQTKVEWNIADMIDASGTIAATDNDGNNLLTAGSWNGSFVFNISRNEHQTTLEGDGQTYHKMAPSALSFRSNAPIDEFQEVLINGEPLDEGAYTLTEGSTIVTLNIDYLETLDIDEYEITVVSKNGAPSADFDVITTNLNDYGFYYNQPYTTYFDSWGQDVVFFMREDGTMDIMLISISMDIMHGTYTINGTEMVVHTEEADYHCNLLLDEQAIYCTELNEKFVIDAEKVAYDDEYLYVYDNYLGGYAARAMDKSKTIYKPIKDNILDVNVVSIEGAFWDCVNMIEAPIIPETVIYIGDAYGGCSSLRVAPKIPNGVTNMIATFSGCTSLTQAPVIPENVIDLDSTFANCINLTGNIEINVKSASTLDCFYQTELPIKIVGNCSETIKAALANSATNGNVTY